MSLRGRNENIRLKPLYSLYFREQLATDAAPITPFPINASTKHLKLILDLMHMKPAPSPAIWAYKTQLLKLADELGAKGVTERILFSLCEHIERDPWAIFVLASQRGSITLAKTALKALDGKEGGVKVDELSLELVKDVSTGYLMGLFAAALKVAQEGEKGVEVGWKAVAERFVPFF